MWANVREQETKELEEKKAELLKLQVSYIEVLRELRIFNHSSLICALGTNSSRTNGYNTSTRSIVS